MNELDIIIRLILAVFVGFLIGLEREKHHRPAGIKTHIHVCVESVKMLKGIDVVKAHLGAED